MCDLANTNQSTNDLHPYPPGHPIHKWLFAIIERRLKSPDPDDRYHLPKLLYKAINMNPDVPLPPLVRQYKNQLDSNKIKWGRGRPPGAVRDGKYFLRLAAAKHTYKIAKRWLKRQKKKGLTEWPLKIEPDWQCEPHHVKAGLLTEKYMQRVWPNVTHRHIVNEISREFGF